MRYWYYRIRYWLIRYLENEPASHNQQLAEIPRRLTELANKQVELSQMVEKLRIMRSNQRYIDSLPSKGDPNYPKTITEIDRQLAHLQFCRDCADKGIEIVKVPRGVHPIGEAINHLESYVQMRNNALANQCDSQPIPSHILTGEWS